MLTIGHQCGAGSRGAQCTQHPSVPRPPVPAPTGRADMACDGRPNLDGARRLNVVSFGFEQSAGVAPSVHARDRAAGRDRRERGRVRCVIIDDRGSGADASQCGANSIALQPRAGAGTPGFWRTARHPKRRWSSTRCAAESDQTQLKASSRRGRRLGVHATSARRSSRSPVTGIAGRLAFVGRCFSSGCSRSTRRHCPSCGGEPKIIAAILVDPAVIERILEHLGLPARPPPCSRAREPSVPAARDAGSACVGPSRACWHTRGDTGKPVPNAPGRPTL